MSSGSPLILCGSAPSPAPLFRLGARVIVSGSSGRCGKNRGAPSVEWQNSENHFQVQHLEYILCYFDHQRCSERFGCRRKVIFHQANRRPGRIAATESADWIGCEFCSIYCLKARPSLWQLSAETEAVIRSTNVSADRQNRSHGARSGITRCCHQDQTWLVAGVGFGSSQGIRLGRMSRLRIDTLSCLPSHSRSRL